jgi:hypothetical protein
MKSSSRITLTFCLKDAQPVCMVREHIAKHDGVRTYFLAL